MDGKACCSPSGDDRARDSPAPVAVVPGAEPVIPNDHWRPIPAGPFTMGLSGPEVWPGDGEHPARDVEAAAFRISKFTVTNAQFAAFVEATGYVTDAQRLGTSFVFIPFLDKRAHPKDLDVHPTLAWWGLAPICHLEAPVEWRDAGVSLGRPMKGRHRSLVPPTLLIKLGIPGHSSPRAPAARCRSGKNQTLLVTFSKIG